MKTKEELLSEAHTILSFLYLRDDLNLYQEKKSELYDLWLEDGKEFVETYRQMFKCNLL